MRGLDVRRVEALGVPGVAVGILVVDRGLQGRAESKVARGIEHLLIRQLALGHPVVVREGGGLLRGLVARSYAGPLLNVDVLVSLVRWLVLLQHRIRERHILVFLRLHRYHVCVLHVRLLHWRALHLEVHHLHHLRPLSPQLVLQFPVYVPEFLAPPNSRRCWLQRVLHEPEICLRRNVELLLRDFV